MSIKNKFESIKKEVSKDRAAADISENKKTVSELIDKKTFLENKITDTQNILTKLEDLFSQSEKKLTDFKAQKEQLNNLFSEYKDYLAEKNINSIQDLLDNPEFADEEEIKQYKGVSAAKDSKGNRGSLGKNIEEVSIIKQEAKESLSDLELDFRGGVKEGEDISPRKQSFDKIKKYIDELKLELKDLNSQEKELKNENLPIIKDLLEDNIEKIFSAESLSVGPMMENLNFIKDEAFSLCGDEFWPEVKKIATDLISQKLQQRFGDKNIFSNQNIDKSLEMEKIIFDANDIKENHKELIDLDNDQAILKKFVGSNNFFMFLDDKVLVKDKKAYSSHVLSKIEYFKQKNIEAKVVCQEIIQEAKEMVKKLEAEIPSKFLAGREEKSDIEIFSSDLKTIKEKLEQTSAPENFYSENKYEFHNNFFAILKLRSGSSQKKWAMSLYKEFRNGYDKIHERFNQLHNNESENLSNFSNELYRISDRSSEKINGFRAFYTDLTETYSYQSSHSKDNFDEFLDSLEGKEFNQAELELETEKRRDFLMQKISNYPNSNIILEKFNKILDRYDNEFRSSDLNKAIQEKNYNRNNGRYGYFKEKENYAFRKDLFYGNEK